MSEDIKQIQLIEQYGIVDEGDIVSIKDLEASEEVVLCREPLKSSWNIEER